jgi:hypothetical protein
VQREFELRDHAEVAAAALQAPEQLGVLGGAGGEQPPVGGDDVGRKAGCRRPGRAAVRAKPLPLPRMKPAMPVLVTRPPVVARPKACVSAIELAPGDAGLRMHAPRCDVDTHALHGPQVEQESAFDGGVAGYRVTAAAHRKRRVELARERDRRDDVGSVRGARDDAGSPIEGRR